MWLVYQKNRYKYNNFTYKMINWATTVCLGATFWDYPMSYSLVVGWKLTVSVNSTKTGVWIPHLGAILFCELFWCVLLLKAQFLGRIICWFHQVETQVLMLKEKDTWRFPEMGYPYIIQFKRIFPYKPSNYWDNPHLWKPPHVCWWSGSQGSWKYSFAA